MSPILVSYYSATAENIMSNGGEAKRKRLSITHNSFDASMIWVPLLIPSQGGHFRSEGQGC